MTLLQRAGVSVDHFPDEEYKKAWTWLVRMKQTHGNIPSKSIFIRKFPKLKIRKVRKKDLPVLVTELRQRKKFMDFLEGIDTASREASDPEAVDGAISNLMVKVNDLSTRSGESSIVDAFSHDVTKRMKEDFKARRRGDVIGIPTGFHRLDYATGGLQPGRMVTLMGRTGMGKSWLNLVFVANAVMNGHKVGLYPLEMTLEETLLRLYTIFSQRMFGNKHVLRNMDLQHGRISKSKFVKFQNALEDRFPGQLFLADLGTMSDPYTMDRVRAETEIYQWDMFWLDYLTLMKVDGIRAGQEDHMTVKTLSNGCKQVATAARCVGGCSVQVNRDALKVRAFLPRPEHIAFGDSIGHDSDLIVSINRKDNYLYYAAVKHRGGPEVGKTRVDFWPDEGKISESKEQDEDDDDD